MNEDRLYLITNQPGFTPYMGRLVSMMNYARATTLHAVKDLTTQQLDFVPAGFGNSIGALLAHLAAVEMLYQVRTFEHRWLTPEEEESRGLSAALDLGKRISELRGRDLAFYANQLETVRNATLEKFATLDDTWLDQEFEFRQGVNTNHYWCWFHVFEDEINHRGQIRLIRKNLPK